MEGELSKSRFKKVAVFCGSSTGNRNCYREAAIELAEELVAKRLDLVYGGGSIGLMGLVAQAVHHAGCNALGIIPRTLMGKDEAIEKLTVMNHPDGDCPMCLSPLVSEDEQNETLPFMKLISCFHCFHSECILQWWNWLQKEKESNGSSSSTTTMRPPVNVENGSDTVGVKEESMGNCPVCRKVFHCEDFRHVLDLVGTHHSQSNRSLQPKGKLPCQILGTSEQVHRRTREQHSLAHSSKS